MRNLLEKIKPMLAKIDKFLSPFKTFINKHYDIFNPIFVLTVICLIVAAALSLTNSLTASRIAAINLENSNKEMAALLPADTYSEVTALWEEAEPQPTIYEAKSGDTVIGYIATNSAKGYGGDISVMTAFNIDKTVKGISILNADEETPGLGQNITKSDFCSRFSGLTTDATVVKESPDISKGEIKAWTGATISSKGVVNAVNEARAALEKYLSMPTADVQATTENAVTDEQTQTDNGGAQIEE